MRALVMVLLMVPLVAAPLGAQRPSLDVPIGARVRVTSDLMRVERWVTRLEAASGDTMFFAQREGQPFAVPVRYIDRLEVSEGDGYSRGLKALHVGLGYVGGAMAGGMIGAAIGAESGESLEGALVLGVFTAIATYREPAFGRGEQWRRVMLPARVGVVPATRGIGVGVSIAL